MGTIISTKKNYRMASKEQLWIKGMFEEIEKMHVIISQSKLNDGNREIINISGHGPIWEYIGLRRAHFALEGSKLYIVPSMNGFWICKSDDNWKATLSNPEIVKALKPYINAKYDVKIEMLNMAGIDGFPMYYVDLSSPIPVKKRMRKYKQVDSQMFFVKAEEGAINAK